MDRSAAYAARYVAKNIVAAGLADRCEVQVAYAIGVAHPVSVMVETYGTERVSKIAELVGEHFDLRPGAIRDYLNLHRPIYQKTAAYGHFGVRTRTSPGRRPTRPTLCGRLRDWASARSEPASASRPAPAAVSGTRHLALDALEAALARERPAIAVARRVAHVLGRHDACRAWRTK